MKLKLLITLFLICYSYSNAQKEIEATKLISKQFQEKYNESDYQSIFQLFSERMKTFLPKEKTITFFTSVKSNYGNIKTKEFLKVTNQGFCSYKVHTTNSSFLLNIAVRNNKIEGLLIKPYLKEGAFKPNKEFVLDFIKNNPDKSSIKIVKNNTVYTEYNTHRLMPLASTVKIIIAIEYATQATKGTIDPEELINLSDLEKFNIVNTDGGAHLKWLKSINSKIVGHKISIREIAKGMITHSSNANTEWLSAKLGLKNINNRIQSLGVKKHSEIYFLASSLFVGKEKASNLKGEAIEKKLRSLSAIEYIEATNQIHEKLLADSNYKSEIGNLTEKVWSDNLPASTTNEYVGLMQKINSRTYFDAKTQKYMDEVMEVYMTNPSNRKNFEHLGGKGGSTAWILTKALYATDKKGNTTELAFFFNDLDPDTNKKLRQTMNDFELNVLVNQKFIEKIQAELK